MRPGLLILAGLLLTAPALAQGQDLASAKAFVTGLYGAYAREPGPDYAGRQAKAVFAPAVLALMRRDAAQTPKGDVGALDGDPICDCQDYEITDVRVSVTAAGPDRATAQAAFKNFGEARTVTLDLVAVGGQWRVADVHTADTPSLVGLFRDSLKAAPAPR